MIRKKTVTRNGREYTYREARITTGRAPGTGKQIQRSFTGKTQKEVREKIQAAAVEINQGTYTAPHRLCRPYKGQNKGKTPCTGYKQKPCNHWAARLFFWS